MSVPEASLKHQPAAESGLLPDGRVKWKVAANNRLRKAPLIDNNGYMRLLYNEYPDPQPVNIKTGDYPMKGLPEEQAKEAFSALGSSSKTFIESLYKAGMIDGLRSITHVKTKDQEWPSY